jgi:hypothetical protein
MIPVAPIVAGIGDFIGILIFILFIVISVVGQIAAKWREAQEQARRRAGQRPLPRPAPAPAPRAAGQPRAGAGQDPLKDEIGEFLRRAAERRGAAQGRPGPPPPPPPPQARPAQMPAARRVEEPIDVEIVEVRPPLSRRPTKQVRQPLGTPRTAAEALGHDIEQADERMAEHLHKVFDHDVGTLRHAQSSVQVHGPLPQTTAAGLAAMFSDPTRLRQAILMNEILQRPEHRWL